MKNNTVVSDNDVRNLERNVYVLHLDFFCSMYIYVYTYAYIYIYIHVFIIYNIKRLSLIKLRNYYLMCDGIKYRYTFIYHSRAY